MGAKAAHALRGQGLLWGVWRLGRPWPGPCREGTEEAGTAGPGTHGRPGRALHPPAGVPGPQFCTSHDLFFMNRNMFILSNTTLSPVLVNL